MSNQPNEEQQRLMRLREKQISTRDPHIKTRKFNQYVAERERNRDKSISLGEIWSVIPQVWKGGVFGLLLGLVLLSLVTKSWISPWAMPASIILTVILMLIGIVIGRALDLRDEIKNQIK